MVENAIVDDSYKHAVPLSPQWLASKNGDSKAVAELPTTPKGSDLDVKRGGGELVDKKKDWRRTASPAMSTQDRERWREDERDTNISGGRRWVEPHGYDSRRDGKWSSRWGPDDKEKEFRRDKWEVERAERAERPADGYRFGRRDGESGWVLHSAATRAPKTASGAGFGRGKGTGFAAGRGKANPTPGSYSAALSGAGSKTAIGAPSASEIANSSSFKYPRAKLLDIYRNCGGSSAFSEKPQNMEDLPDVMESIAQDPLAFIPPNDDEKAALDSVWNVKSASDAQKLKDDAGVAKENDCQEINVEVIKEKRDEVVEEAKSKITEPPVALVAEGAGESRIIDDLVSKLNVQTDNPPIESMDPKKVAPEDLSLRYVDPQGVIQGPFSGRDIMTWYEAEYFTSELLVQEESVPETAPFVPLREVMPHLVNSSHVVHKAAEDELDGLKDCFPEKLNKSQTDALSSILPVESSTLPAAVPARNALLALRDDRLAQQFVQKERSYVHELEELELVQMQQLEQTRQHAQPLPQPPLHLQPPFLDPLHAKTGLPRALSIDRTLDPLRREQLAAHLIEQQALQNDYQHGLFGLEKQMLQQHGERLLADQYLQMIQPRHQQEMLLQVLQQKHHEMLQQELIQQKQHQHELLQQKQHELLQQKQHELLQQKQHELLQLKQHELLQQKQHELLQQKQHELLQQQKQHELNRLLNLQQQMNYPERRITGVWKVDESGHPMRVVENHPRLQHQSSLPALYNRDAMVSPFDGRDRALGNLDLRAAAGMQRLSNENAFLHQPRQEMHQGISKDALQAIMAGAGNRGMPAASSWGMHEQYMKDLQVPVSEHPVLQSQKLERQGMSSQDYIVQQLMRNQQLHDRKVKIEQHMMQPSLEKLWAEDFDNLNTRNVPHGNFGTSAPSASEAYLKQSAPLPNQGFDVQKGFSSGSVSSYDGIITDDFHGPVREVESRKVKTDASDLQGRKFDNGIQNLANHSHSRTVEVAQSKSPGIQDLDSAKFLNMKSITDKLSNGNLQQAAHAVTNADFPTLTKGSTIPLAPQTLYTTAEVKTFRRWCETQIKDLTGKNDMSPLEHCILLPSALEAEHFLSQSLGNSPTAQAFKGEFLRCRELMTPQMIQVFVANSEVKDAGLDTKAASNNQPQTVKKKSKKAKKLDPSLLGFNVASNRMLMGEIHHVDSL